MRYESMRYESDGGLADLAVGLLNGATAHFGEQIELSRTTTWIARPEAQGPKSRPADQPWRTHGCAHAKDSCRQTDCLWVRSARATLASSDCKCSKAQRSDSQWAGLGYVVRVWRTSNRVA